MLDFLGLEEEALRVLWSCIIIGIALGIEAGALAGANKKIEFNNEAKATTGEIVLLVFCILLGVVGFLIGILPGIMLLFTFQWKYIIGAIFAGVLVCVLVYFLVRAIVLSGRRAKYKRNPIVAEAVAFCKQNNIVGVQCFVDGMRFFTAIEHPHFCQKQVTLEKVDSFSTWNSYKESWKRPEHWAVYDRSPNCIKVMRFADHGYNNVPDLAMFAETIAKQLHFSCVEHSHKVQYDSVTSTATTRTTTHNIAILHEDFFVYCPEAHRRTVEDWENRGLLFKPAPAKSTLKKTAPKKKDWE